RKPNSKLNTVAIMKAPARLHFDVDILRKLAGERVFERGQRYHRDGNVQILSIGPGKVVAEVAGTQDYRTVLTANSAELYGECSCPAFQDWGFCKHLVAVALSVNEGAADGDADGLGALTRVREHLEVKSKGQLVDMILALAEREPELFRKLNTQAVMASADD